MPQLLKQIDLSQWKKHKVSNTQNKQHTGSHLLQCTYDIIQSPWTVLPKPSPMATVGRSVQYSFDLGLCSDYDFSLSHDYKKASCVLVPLFCVRFVSQSFSPPTTQGLVPLQGPSFILCGRLSSELATLTLDQYFELFRYVF